ncbi:MAG: ArnT family glycosyltransferase, partial [Planctomycetia bacterium]
LRLGDRMFGRPAGLFAAVLLAPTLPLQLLGKLCIPDGPQFFFGAVCFAALWNVFQGDPKDAVVRRWSFLFWLSLAGTLLTKGPIIAAMAVVSLTAFRLLTGARFKEFALRPLVGAVVVTAAAGPWFAAIYYAAGPGFFAEAVGKQIGMRLFQSFDGGFHPPGYYLALLPVGLAPWFPLLLLAVVRLRGELRRIGPEAYCAAWAIGPMLLLDLFRSKQIHYYAPAYPALALLTAAYLAKAARRETAWTPDGHAWRAEWCTTAAGFAAAIGFAAFGWYYPEAAIIATFAALLAAAAAWAAQRQFQGARSDGRRVAAVVSLYAAAAFGLGLAVDTAVLPVLEQQRLGARIGLAAADAAKTDGEPLRIVPYRIVESSLTYYSGQPIRGTESDNDFCNLARFGGRPWLSPMFDADYRTLSARLPGRLTVLQTWRGWINWKSAAKRRVDVVHLVRVDPAPAETERSVPYPSPPAETPLRLADTPKNPRG